VRVLVWQVRHRVRTGQWQALKGRVLALPGIVWSASVRDRAAQLAVRGSILAGPSAARFWGMGVPDGSPCLAVAAHTHPSFDGARILRVDLPPADVVRGPDSVRVTSLARTVYDCLALLPEDPAQTLLDRALQQRWITVDDLARRIRNNVGGRGVRQQLRLLRRAATGTRSEAERIMVRLLRRSGIRGWHANRAIRDARGLIGIGDVVFPEVKLVIEIDGWAYHADPEPFQRDRERQNRLVAAGWTVLRFTWRDLTEHPDRVLRTIRTLLAAR